MDAFDYFFSGRERDAESGNDYFGARYYNSATGSASLLAVELPAKSGGLNRSVQHHLI